MRTANVIVSAAALLLAGVAGGAIRDWYVSLPVRQIHCALVVDGSVVRNVGCSVYDLPGERCQDLEGETTLPAGSFVAIRCESMGLSWWRRITG